MSRPLLILACSATKREGGQLHACERYDGPAYRVLRASGWPSVEEGPDCRLLILSAEHGLLSPWRVIDTYDRPMDEERAAELAQVPVATLRDQLFLPVPATRGRQAFDTYPTSEVFVHGGWLYRRVVEAWAAAGAFGDIPVSYSVGGIGVQLAQLKQWLAARRAVEVTS